MADTESQPLHVGRRKTITSPDAPFLLSLPQRFAYGVGHVLNDLCASMWFSYLLVFYHAVLHFNNVNAGYMMLIGQVSDALCTPLIGYESDKTLYCRYGKRKTWHLLGTICVMCSFIFIFGPPLGSKNSSQLAELIYFTPFIVIFQFGWASTQISHLSLIPELTNVATERVALNALRYTFTVFANIFVYGICWVLLNSTSDVPLGPSDIPQFRYLAIITVGTGAIFSLIFHIGTKEPQESRTSKMPCCLYNLKKYGRMAEQCKMLWKDWLFEPQFYQVALIYMCSRLMINVSQVYIPMYVTETLGLNKTTIALVPLVIYVSGFLASFVVSHANKYLGRKLTYFLSIVVFLGGCGWLYVPDIQYQVYGAAVLLGTGGSMLLVTALAFTSDLIAHNTESGAFVYGAMSFTDKLSNGIAVMIIQYLHPCVNCCPACKGFYQNIQVFVPGGAGIVALFVLLTMIPITVGIRKSPPRSYSHSVQTDDSECEAEPCEECKKLFPVSSNSSPAKSYRSSSYGTGQSAQTSDSNMSA